MAVSKRLRFEILRRDQYTCRYCGAKAPDVPLRVDHVIPESLGGTDESDNLVTACEPCNTGKTSIAPDSPIVADVAADALRWARAMALASAERVIEHARMQKLYTAFDDEWTNWTNGYGDTCPRPARWKDTIDQLLRAGLTMDDLIELIDVAMSSRADDTWRYWCGCCWKRLRKLQERAAELVREGEFVG